MQGPGSTDRNRVTPAPGAVASSLSANADARKTARPATTLAMTPKAAGIAERIAQICALVFAVIYLASGVAYLCLDYWPVTESDFWQIYDTCLNHSWMESALLKFNNHSLFFPSFIWLADLRFFHGDQGVLFTVGLLLLIISTLLLLMPIWREPAMDLTGKCLGTLVIIFGSFWMGRATITTSGGFNCMTSSVTLGAAAGFLLLPNMRAASPYFWRTTTLLICAGFVATFSFGSGVAVWPSLLFLGWNLRLPGRSLAILVLATLSALLIYRFLPPPDDASVLWESMRSHLPTAVIALNYLCWLVGAPLFYSITAWQGIRPSSALIESSGWLLWGGAAGLALALIAMGSQFARRDLKGNSMEFVGLALISFNLCVLLLVVAARVERFQEISTDPTAPRYLFWTSLFWAGLLLLALHHVQRRRWLRWPCILFVLAFSIAGWQEHLDEGFRWRNAKLRASRCATSLINGVTDPRSLFAASQEQVDILAPQLRARRLDMFAAGIQDWIGRPAAELFGRDREKNRFRGKANVERIPNGPDRDSAVRVVGLLYPGKHAVPSTMVVLDAQETVVGIARSFATSNLFNSLLFGNRMPGIPLHGYIRQYDPAIRYTIRSADNRRMSDQEIQIGESTPTR